MPSAFTLTLANDYERYAEHVRAIVDDLEWRLHISHTNVGWAYSPQREKEVMEQIAKYRCEEAANRAEAIRLRGQMT